jgi:hypothetical protein
MLVFFCAIAFGMLLMFGLGLVSGPAITHMVRKESFVALFQVKEWGQVLRANLGGYLVAIFLYVGLVYAIQILFTTFMVTFVLCGLLPILLFAVTPYASVFMAALFGQAYREGSETLAAADDPAGDEKAEPLPDPVI